MSYKTLTNILPIDVVNNVLSYAHNYENEYVTHVLHLCKLINCLKIKCIRYPMYKLKENKTGTKDIYKEKIKVIKDDNFAKFLVYVNSNSDSIYYMSISFIDISSMFKITDYVDIFPKQLHLFFIKYWIKKHINRCEDCSFQYTYKHYKHNTDKSEFCCVNCDYSKCTNEIVMSCPGPGPDSDFDKHYPYFTRRYYL